jgi:AcrR family transcriptional regulator
MARPRDPEVDARILRAVRSLIDVVGVAEVTVDAVANCAGVSRPTIYRRWATRAELLFAAQTNASAAVEFPDTGSLAGDLAIAVAHLADVMASSDRSVSGEQMGRMIADADFAERVWSTRWIPDRIAVYALWERAGERGEVDPDIDGHAVIDDLVAVCLFRVALGHQVLEPSDVDALVERVLYGVIGDRRQP